MFVSPYYIRSYIKLQKDLSPFGTAEMYSFSYSHYYFLTIFSIYGK